MARSFLFYDYEAHGIDPLSTRPASFAAIRTDENLNRIEPPIELLCRLSDDFIPSPMALSVHQLSIKKLQNQGMCEAEFARTIYKALNRTETINIGFCSHNYDRKLTHALFHRNLLPLYDWHMKPNASFDTYGFLCLIAAIDSDVIRFGKKESGKLSSTLSHFSEANNIEHHAHDALSDVKVTLELTKRAKQAYPDFWEYALQMSCKTFVFAELAQQDERIFVHAGRGYGSTNFVAPVLPVLAIRNDQGKPESILLLNLSQPLDILFELSPLQIREAMVKKEKLDDHSLRLPLMMLRCNANPALLPLEKLQPQHRQALPMDWTVCDENRNTFNKLREKINEAFDGYLQVFERDDTLDIDDQIYNGFPSNIEKAEMGRLLTLTPQEALATQAFSHASTKYQRLFKRFIARNYPELLSTKEQEQWHKFRLDLLTGSSSTKKVRVGMILSEFKAELAQARALENSQPLCVLLDELEEYVTQLVE